MLILLLNQNAGAGSQNLSPTLVTNSQSFFSPTVSIGAVSLLPPLVSDGDTFFAATVSGGATENRFQMDYGVFVPPRRRKEEPEPPVDETYDEEIAVLLLAA